MTSDSTGDSGADPMRVSLIDGLERVRSGSVSAEDYIDDLRELLEGVPLYPADRIRSLGIAAGDLLDRSPAVAVDMVLRLISSPAKEVRGFGSIILFRLARFQPGMWVDPARHLTCDEDWEVRDLAAHVFDTQNGIEGAAAFHLEFVVKTISEWSKHSDERVRRAATQALLGFAGEHPEFRRKLLQMIGPLVTDEQEYVRHSLAAALRTMGRMDPELVFEFISANIEDAPEEARDVFRLTLDHPFADRHPQRKAELVSRL